ncbi:MAG: Uma2 family endonuclease [Bacteroidota bacterium]
MYIYSVLRELQLDRVYSLEEYIALELAEPNQKYEFIKGHIYTRSGGSIHHGIIISNTSFLIKEQLKQKKKDCTTLGSDVKLAIKENHTYLYPDITVICGPIEIDKNVKEAISNPGLIIEVLSKSTQDYDQSRKFRLYRSIPSITEYVMIDPYQVAVESFYQKGGGDWYIQTYESLEEELSLQSLDISIKLQEIYQKVLA